MIDYFLDFFKFISICLLFIAIVIAAVFCFGAIAGSYSCSKYQEATGRPTKYIGLECYINENGQWFAWSEYKLRFATNGANK